MNQKYVRFIPVITVFGCLVPISIQAQIVPDTTLPENSLVTPQGEVIQIDGGTTRGNNLFHSFQEFSVPVDMEASFNNADTISNILSRVTGDGESLIDGGIRANGAANLFLINPAGIVFGEGAFLDVGGSFIGTTAESLLFPDGFEYSASDPQAPPLLTINAPIGLGFRDEPGPIKNYSLFADDNGTPDDLNDDLFIGLEVFENQTLALIGGELIIDEGIITTVGGRIELGSVAGNSTVSLTPIEQGFDVRYEGVSNFQNISLSAAAFVQSFGEFEVDTGNIELRGKNISLTEGSFIGIETEEGQAGNLTIIASESVNLDGSEAGDFPTELSNLVFEQEVGNGGNITISTKTLTVNDGGQILTSTIGPGNGGDLIINASESIEVNGTIPESTDPSALFTIVDKEITATGDGGNLTINTPRLIVSDGAQIATSAQNEGNGGDLTINATESVLLTGTSDLATTQLGRSGIFTNVEPAFEDSETGEIVSTTGTGGTLNLTTKEFIVEEGAIISANTFSEGQGGNANINVDRLIVRSGGEIGAGSLIGEDSIDANEPQPIRGPGGNIDINATESVEVTGATDINGDTANSSLFTLAESNGNAGNTTLTIGQLIVSDGGDINASAKGSGSAGSVKLTANNLTVKDGGEINVSASDLGAAGNLTIRVNNLNLNQGILNAETAAGTGGNITLDIDDTITLSSESLISAAATGTADGGNINIDTTFIIASPQGNSDILANAQQGTGGRIIIDAESIFGLRVRPPSDRTNDIDASGGVDGEVIINTPDTDLTGEALESPPALVEGEQTVVQACRSDRLAETSSGLTILGKGGVPPKPTEPLNSDAIIVDGQTTATNLQSQYPEIKPIKTQYGDIMPARDMIKTEDGRVILTAYPTDNIDRRTPHISAKCN